MSGKKAGADAGVAVDDLRGDIAATRHQLSETTGELADRTATKSKVGLGTIVAGAIAAAAAFGALRWRKSRQQPKNRAKRMWRDAKGKARDVKKDVEGRARKVKSRLS